ncbi:hypothetical protein [Pseudomonas sp. LD120]|uniref:hypothetical protein n=1 Tax=Pseudomonas sp. LD120 TaxID=485751 RepID=UPI00135ADCCD|nr:hypothetical protein [Pseudomonas sp. LD120]KAF0863947.1 hypothetical protein PLD_25215 [Pseudomonas sp. LD120]
MSINPNLVEALYYLSLIILAPIFFKLSRILTRYLLNRFVSTGKVVVIYKRNGLVVGRKTINTTAYVVDQLKSAKGGA